MRAGPPRPRSVAAAWVAAAAIMLALAAAGDYRLSVAAGAAVLAVAAVGVDVSVGSAGMLVFSAPAFMQVGALATALVGLRSGLPPTAATGAGLAAGLAAGLILAVAVGAALRRVGGIAVALLTLFVLHLVRGVVRQQEALGGTIGLSGVPAFEALGFRAATPATQATVAMAALALVLAAATRFLRSGPGRELLAVRGDPPAAAACGVSGDRRRFEAFVFGSLCATLAGGLYAHTFGFASADALGLGVLMDLLLIVFLGGVGSVWGVVPGAIAVRMVPEVWAGPERLEVLARGAAFLLVLSAAPGGLAGVVRQAGGRLRHRRVPPVAAPAPGSPPPRPVPRPARPAAEPLLEVDGVSRAFGGLRALDGVELTVGDGELCAVVGPNGAGKTTLFNVVAGSVAPQAGRVHLRGADVTALPPHRRARLGVARTFQEVRLFPGLTVLDHALVGTGAANRLGPGVLLGGPGRSRGQGGRGGRPGEGDAVAAAREALEVTGLSDMAAAMAEELPFGWQRRVELARAVAARPALLLLDEPASGLSRPERDALAEVIRRLPPATAVLVVEHDVDFVLGLARRVLVLDGGRVVFDGSPEAATADPAVAGAYLARRAPATGEGAG